MELVHYKQQTSEVTLVQGPDHDGAPAVPAKVPPKPQPVERPLDELVGEVRVIGAPASSGIDRTSLRLVATGQWLPVWLAVSTVFWYLAKGFLSGLEITPLGVVGLGAATGAIGWVLYAASTSHSVLAARANVRSYEELLARLPVVRTELARQLAAGEIGAAAAPVAQLRNLVDRLEASPPLPDWTSGKGYVLAWRQLHRIEEGLLASVDAATLEDALRHDELRIEGSKLDSKDNPVRQRLDEARKSLADGKLGQNRSLLLAIRQAVNDFRDRRFEALVEGRAYLEHVSAALGAGAWAMLAMAILLEAPRNAVIAVSAFYVIGAAAGLFTQLRGTGVTESVENIFGYGQAELRQTILLAGIAAVGGVFLTWVAMNSSELQAVDFTAALALTPFSLLTAAVFGVAPATLQDRLDSWAKANISDLESTLGGEGKAS
jgi:hypothetical protein